MIDKLLRILNLRQGSYDIKMTNIIQYPGKNEEVESKEPLIKCRYMVVLFGFASEFLLYAHRLTMGVSIVTMVNNTALPKLEEAKSQSCIGIIGNASSIEEYNDDITKEDGEFLWSPEMQGYILGSGFLLYALGTAPTGILTQRFGGKKVLIWGLFLSSLFTVLSPFAAWWNVYVLILVQGLRGLAQAGFVPAESVLISNWCTKSERGFSFSFMLTGSCWGAAIGSYVSGLLCKSKFIGGWPLVFYVFGGLGIIVAFFGLFIYDNPSIHPSISAAEFKYITSNQENVLTTRKPNTPWKSLFTSVPLYALTFAIFGQMWAISHFSMVHPTFLRTILYYPIKQNALINFLQFVLQSITSLGAAFLSTFLNNKNYMSIDTARKFWTLLSCAGYSGCMLGIYFAGCNRSVSVILSVAALACTGFGYAGCWIVSADMSPTFSGSVNAVSCTVSYTANFIMPVVVGVLTDDMQTMEQWNKVFFISIGVVISSGIIFAVFGSAEVQSWNFVHEDEPKNKNDLKLTTGCQEECHI